MKCLNCFIFVASLLTFGAVLVSSVGLNEELTWTRINFEWPRKGELRSLSSLSTQSQPTKAKPRYGSSGSPIVFEGDTNGGEIGNGANQDKNETATKPGSIDYQYVNNIPMGANVWKDKVFITVPRRRHGVPSTLNYVSLNNKNRHNLPLKPYPNWNINVFPDTSGKGENFVSVYRTAIDVCDRLWFVDAGILEIPGNRTFVRNNHQLVVIDLQTDQIIHRYDIPESVIKPATTLASITIDVTKENCGDAYAYFPDLAGFGVTVYSLKENHSWRVNHNYFFLESLNGEFHIAGHDFQWNDGVFSVELSDIKPDGYRDMYFHALAGTHIFRVSTRIIRNEALATRGYHGKDFEDVGDRGELQQTATADIHKPTGIMFLGLVNQNALGCWNIKKPLNTVSIVKKDDDKMIYPSDVKIVGNKVYVLTNTMPGFLYGMLDYDKINFRVWSNDVNSAVEGTACQSV